MSLGAVIDGHHSRVTLSIKLTFFAGGYFPCALMRFSASLHFSLCLFFSARACSLAAALMSRCFFPSYARRAPEHFTLQNVRGELRRNVISRVQCLHDAVNREPLYWWAALHLLEQNLRLALSFLNSTPQCPHSIIVKQCAL